MIKDNFDSGKPSENIEEIKYCTKCEINIRAKSRHWCKECFNFWARAYYNKRPKIENKTLNPKRNYKIGNFDDNIDLLNSAIKYINHYKNFENNDEI